MKDDPTVFGDRETVELLSAHPELLAIADAVHATQRKKARASTPRVRLLLAAAAVAGLSAVCAVVLTGPSGGTRTTAVYPLLPLDRSLLPRVFEERREPDTAAAFGPVEAGPVWTFNGAAPSPDLFDYTITRENGAISSIAVTVRGIRVDSTAELEVHMWGPGSPRAGRAVFSERVSLNPILSPPPGTVARTEWSGTLSPSDWDGGCQDATYQITVRIREASDWVTQIQPGGFNCRQAAVGPTGGGGPTG